jgi:hypothetical protein
MHSGPYKSVSKMTHINRHPPGEPITLGNVTNTENYCQLAAQEAALARVAVTNESRAHHYEMAAYYTRLAEAKEKVATTADPMRPLPFGK